MPFARCTLLSFLPSLALSACAGPDGEGDADGDCGLLPATEVVQGGLLKLPAGLNVEVEHVDARVVRDDDEGVWLRAPFEVGEHPLRATCADGEARATLRVSALTFEPLVDWDGEPQGREYFSWWIDDGSDRLYLYGGFVYEPAQFTPNTDLFALDLLNRSWSPVELLGDELPLPGHRVAQHDGVTWAFGGATLDAEGLATPPALGTFEAAGDAMAFIPLDADGAPGSYTGFVFFDPVRGALTSVCGADTVSLGLHCKVHRRGEDGVWDEVSVTGPEPPGRYGFHAAYDPLHDRVVVFGGQVGPANLDVGGDTWALELAAEGGPRWIELFVNDDTAAPARRNGAYAYDPVNHTLLVWGGTPNGTSASPGLDVLTLDAGAEAWNQVDSDAFPPRASGQGVFHAASQSVLWGMGNSTAGIYTDLYAMPVVAR
jgi:hypothetical protein